MRVRRYWWIALGPLAAALGLAGLWVARRDPADSFAGTSTSGAIAYLAGGWSLVAAGIVFSTRHRGNQFGLLITAAGFVWLLPGLADPGVESSFGFTIGLVALVACVPVVSHAALAYPTGRLRSVSNASAIAASYAGALLLLGLLPAAVFDPQATGCHDCPTNLVLVRADDGLFRTFNLYGLRIAIAWIAACGVLLVWRLVRSRRVAPILLPVIVPALAYLGLVAWDFQHSLARGILSNDAFDQSLWRYEAGALVALALGVAWGLVRERRARAAVARLVVELGRAPEPGTVRAALAATLDDRGLELAYRRSGAAAYVDAAGRPLKLDPGLDRAVTPIVRARRPVAALVHDAALLAAGAPRGGARPRGSQSRTSGSRPRCARSSRSSAPRATRIVERGDAERRRLERDLHDGAQQRLLALSYDLRLARGRRRGRRRPASRRCSAAVDEAQAALEELRELAHGIYPAILDRGRARGRARDARRRRARCRSSSRRAGRALRRAGRGRRLRRRRGGDRRRRAARRDLRRASRDRRGGSTRRRRSTTTARTRTRRSSMSPTASARSAAARCRDRTRSGGDAVRVVVADDVMLTREGIVRLLRDAGVDVVAGRGRRRAAAARRARAPDAAIVDIRMPPTHTDEGLVAAQRIRSDHPDVGVLVLSQYVEPSYAMRLLEEHPERVGYLLKERVFDVAILVDALRRIGDGETVVDPTIVSRLVGRRRRNDPLDRADRRASARCSASSPRGSRTGDRGAALRHRADGRGARQADLPQARLSAGPGVAHRRVLAVLACIFEPDGASPPLPAYLQRRRRIVAGSGDFCEHTFLAKGSPTARTLPTLDRTRSPALG